MLKADASFVTSTLTGLSRVPAVPVISCAAMATGFMSLFRTAMISLPSFSVTSPCMDSLVLNSRIRPLFGPSSIAPCPKAKPVVRAMMMAVSLVFIFFYVCRLSGGWSVQPESFFRGSSSNQEENGGGDHEVEKSGGDESADDGDGHGMEDFFAGFAGRKHEWD